MNSKIKICGITTKEDLLFSAKAGANLLGINLWNKSPRSVILEEAAKLLHDSRKEMVLLPEIVLVFVEPELEFLSECIKVLKPSAVQIHGEWSKEIEVNGVRVIRAFQFGSEEDIDEIESWPGSMILLDAHVEGMYGGTGRSISKELVCKVKRPYILAGGLTPENVAGAIKQFEPWGVDVASGVENAPGKKDHSKVKSFIDSVKMGTVPILRGD